jgi:hypothetical protein
MSRRVSDQVRVSRDASQALELATKQQMDAADTAHAVLLRPHPSAAVTIAGTTGDITFDASLGRHFRVTMGGARRLSATIGMQDGMMVLLEILQDGVGGRVLTFQDANGGWVDGGNAITISTVANKRSYIVAVYHSGLQRWHMLGVRAGF